jgi:hypothetical protein
MSTKMLKSWKILLLASAILLSGCVSTSMTGSKFMASLKNYASYKEYDTPFERMLVKKMISANENPEWMHDPATVKALFRAVYRFDNFWKTLTKKEQEKVEKLEAHLSWVVNETNIINYCFRASAIPPFSISNIDHDCLRHYGYVPTWEDNVLEWTDEYLTPWKYKNNIPRSQTRVTKFAEKSEEDKLQTERELDADTHAKYLDMIRNYTVGDWLSDHHTNVLLDVMDYARVGKIHLAPEDLKHAERAVDAWLLTDTGIKIDCWRVESTGKTMASKFHTEPPYPECLAFYGYPMSKKRLEEMRQQNALPAEPAKKTPDMIAQEKLEDRNRVEERIREHAQKSQHDREFIDYLCSINKVPRNPVCKMRVVDQRKIKELGIDVQAVLCSLEFNLNKPECKKK